MEKTNHENAKRSLRRGSSDCRPHKHLQSDHWADNNREIIKPGVLLRQRVPKAFSGKSPEMISGKPHFPTSTSVHTPLGHLGQSPMFDHFALGGGSTHSLNDGCF